MLHGSPPSNILSSIKIGPFGKDRKSCFVFLCGPFSMMVNFTPENYFLICFYIQLFSKCAGFSMVEVIWLSYQRNRLLSCKAFFWDWWLSSIFDDCSDSMHLPFLITSLFLTKMLIVLNILWTELHPVLENQDLSSHPSLFLHLFP